MCWICESWIDTTISVDLNALGITYEVPSSTDSAIEVYIHFDFDDFQPDLMEDLRLKGMAPGKFQISRMMPQQTCLYFFSCNGEPFLNMKTPTVSVDDNIKHMVSKTFHARSTLRHELPSIEKLSEFALDDMHVVFGDSLVEALMLAEKLRKQEEINLY